MKSTLLILLLGVIFSTVICQEETEAGNDDSVKFTETAADTTMTDDENQSVFPEEISTEYSWSEKEEMSTEGSWTEDNISNEDTWTEQVTTEELWNEYTTMNGNSVEEDESTLSSTTTETQDKATDNSQTITYISSTNPKTTAKELEYLTTPVPATESREETNPESWTPNPKECINPTDSTCAPCIQSPRALCESWGANYRELNCDYYCMTDNSWKIFSGKKFPGAKCIQGSKLRQKNPEGVCQYNNGMPTCSTSRPSFPRYWW